MLAWEVGRRDVTFYMQAQAIIYKILGPWNGGRRRVRYLVREVKRSWLIMNVDTVTVRSPFAKIISYCASLEA
jgi:hypothetical protein